jgi:hypothetical protein
MLPEAERALLSLLDGTRTRPEIAAAHWPVLAETERLRQLDVALDTLGRQALLMR